MSNPFHVAIHPRSARMAEGPIVSLDRGQFQTLTASGGDFAESFDCTFEEVCDALAELPRMFLEPDGSFVWVSSPGEPAWQLDGMLYDRDERLLYVELKGGCPAERLNRLLAAVGWPHTPVVFQLIREAVFLGEAQFRHYAGWTADARPIE